jgi:MoxR-like ATPase
MTADGTPILSPAAYASLVDLARAQADIYGGDQTAASALARALALAWAEVRDDEAERAAREQALEESAEWDDLRRLAAEVKADHDRTARAARRRTRRERLGLPPIPE